MRTLFPGLLAIVFCTVEGEAQVYEHPNFSLTSHPTLEISSAERWEDQMVLNLVLKNERYSASFCLDSNTVLVNSLGREEYGLVSMEGIPAGPEMYRFKSIGERISMHLVFEAVPDDVKYIDLVEKCDQNCVSVKYILLDEELNNRLREGIQLYELGRPEPALQVFKDIMDENYDGLSPVFGTIYLYLISIHYDLGQSREARNAFRELQESSILGRDEFIRTAREAGIIR